MKALKEQIEVMQACDDGADVEMTNPKTHNDYWGIGNSHRFNWDAYDYQIKPKPLEFWVNVYDQEQATSPDKNNSFNPKLGFGKVVDVIKVKQVTE